MKVSVVPRTVCVQAIASMFLLSSCDGGGNSTDERVAADDCTQTLSPSTSLEIEVDINGNITLVPTANNTLSGCGSSSEPDGTIELTASITSRYGSPKDFDVWECDTEDGSNFYYAFLKKWNNFSKSHFGLEIGPIDSSLPASQTILWHASNADTLLISAAQEDIDIEWTDIQFPSVDTMSANSATRGALQCALKTVDDNESLFGFDVVLSSQAAGSDGTLELISRIETNYVSLVNLEYWQCTGEDGLLFFYTFFDYDYPSAPSRDGFLRYGLDYPSGADYFWRATSADSLLQELNEQERQIEWTDIRFPASKRMTATSSSDGALSCYLQNFGGDSSRW